MLMDCAPAGKQCDDANSLQELLDQRHRGAALLLIAIISTQRKHK
jgi:hypothetical protein